MKTKSNLTKNLTNQTQRPKQSILRFSPAAWAKLLYLRDAGPTEVGGFGITSIEDPLLVIDFALVEQDCSSVTVAFQDDAVAEFFDAQVDLGRRPAQFARIWIHTHPGHSAKPSVTDEETFERVFGATDWAVMFILARGGQTYCRLQFHVGPAAAVELAVQIDYQQPFAASDHCGWLAEYEAKVHQLVAVAEVKELLGKDPPLWCPEKQNNAHSGWFIADDLMSESDADQAWEEYLQTYEEYAYGYY